MPTGYTAILHEKDLSASEFIIGVLGVWEL